MVATPLDKAQTINLAEIMDAEDIVYTYTSVPLENPREMVHTTAGYMVQAYTFKNVFNYEDN
jgi:acyl-coenzyme A synthetase/AMP-(fatty) acid ligase